MKHYNSHVLKLLSLPQRTITCNLCTSKDCYIKRTKRYFFKVKEDNNTMAKITLIVEDDTSIGEVLVYAISQATSYTALTVSDGFEALEIIKGVKPDLFILDYQLPRMTGIELYDRLHSLQGLEHIPTIIMSANLPESAIRQRHLIGITKPFELDELLDTIEKLIA